MFQAIACSLSVAARNTEVPAKLALGQELVNMIPLFPRQLTLVQDVVIRVLSSPSSYRYFCSIFNL
jgi:hypothetical protein